jgi:hypothetical protein
MPDTINGLPVFNGSYGSLTDVAKSDPIVMDPFKVASTPLLNLPTFVSKISPLNTDLSQTGKGSGSTGFNNTFEGPDPWVGYRPRLCFPIELTHSKNNWMFMSFGVRVGNPGAREIYLPIPPGLTFSDSMSYSSLDLGILGAIGQDTIKAMEKANGIKNAVGAGIGGLAGSLVNKAKKMNIAAASSIAARYFRQESIANTIDFSTKQVVSPNTNTAFQNTGIRSFGFNFKMMPKSKVEAETITAIIKTFRENMYPKGNDVVLSYPPIWSMKFYEGSGRENRKIPKIYECYLVGMTATYNGTTNMFHEDGSPVETDVALQFQETRALTLTDIVRLSEQ